MPTDSSALTRVTLLQRLKDNADDVAWEEFSRIYTPYIYAVSRAMGTPQAECPDVAQQVALRAWKHLPQFDYDRSKGTFRSWLATVTRNAVRTHMSRQNRQPSAVDPQNIESLADRLDDAESAEIDAIVEREWQLFVSRQAWERVGPQLSDSVREVFSRLSRGDTPAAIAESMGIERNTVYVYRRRVEHLMCREIRRLDEDLG